ncbi:MAG: methyltransferase domain-containing protein [Deltaproteobacteria bacterium]|nr:methyltransferase domain-containing protein [Nannocystaceae bacterium]
MSHGGRKQPSIDLRSDMACDPGMVVFLSSAFACSSALFTAVELGVFDRLEHEPDTLEGLSSELGLPVHALERLMVLLHSLGLVERDDDAHYRNAAVASQLLTQASPRSLVPFLLHQQRHMYPLFEHLSEAVRTGGPQVQRLAFASALDADDRGSYTSLARSPADNRLFLAAMNAVAVDVGRVIAERVDLSTIRTLLDFGGGGGQIAIELAEAAPHLDITIVDAPEVCAFADEVIAGKGLASRVHTCAGDFLGELPASLVPADAVLLGGVLADWGPEQRRVLLANARTRLVPGGLLLVSETLLDPTNSGPVLPALLSLAMLVATRGKNFTPQEVLAMLDEAGLVGGRVISNRELGVRDLVLANRP